MAQPSKHNKPIEIWSDEMIRLVDHCAKYQDYRFWKRRLGLDEYRQEGFLAAAEYYRRMGVAVVDSDPLITYMKTRMRLLYDDKLRIRRNGVVVGKRSRIPIDDCGGRMWEDRKSERDAVLDIRSAVERLSPNLRAIVWAKYREMRTGAEVAVDVGVPLSEVREHYRTAYEALRRLVSDAYNFVELRRVKRRGANFYRKPRADWSDWGPIPDQRDDD